MSQAQPGRSPRLGPWVAAVALVVASVSVATISPSASQAAVPGVEVTFAPSTVVDGQAVSVTVKAASPVVVARAEAHLCRAGVDYKPSTAERFAADFELDGPNCPRQPISTSADAVVIDQETSQNAGTPEGEVFLFRAGVGVVEWNAVPGGQPTSLTCDADHPCALVVELRITEPGKANYWQPFVQAFSYSDDNPFLGCGGGATGVLNTGGSDRVSDAWVSWTIGECLEPGRHGAAGRASFVGEGPAVASFARGDLDLAYTGGGYNDTIGLAGDPALSDGGRRAAVSVPTALNATVLAVGGGVRVSGHKVPFRDIRLTAAEAATLIAGGVDGIQPLIPAIKERNPEIEAAGFFDVSGGFQVGAYADAEVTSWYASRFFKDLAPDAWKVPDRSTFGEDRGRARGIDVSLATADPSFVNALSLLSGRPSLRKGLIGPSALTAGGIWVLTDLATARALGLTPVSIGNARGDFVAPTPETMQAALATMTADANGVLVADPRAVAPVGQVQPYPLTFVEYAMAPAEPLLDSDCAPRTDSQALLGGWLTYITGAGQAKLPAGMLALGDGLKAEAAAAIPKVGASPVTGPCKDAPVVTPDSVQAPATTSTVPTSPTPTTSGALAALQAPVGGQDLSRAGTSSPGSGSGTTVTTVARRAPAPPTQEAASGTESESAAPATPAAASSPARSLVAIPPFRGRQAVALGGTVLALMGMMVINAGAGLGSSPAMARVRRALRLEGQAEDSSPPG